MTKTLSQVLNKMPRDYTAQLMRKECSIMYSPVDVSRIQYMTLKQKRAARRKQAQNQLVRQMAKVAVQSSPQKKKKNKPFATVGQTLGSAVGSMFGSSSLGGGVGRWLGKGIGSIFGSGDYEMVGQNPSYNVLTNGAQIPKFSTTRATNVVSHREYLGDITGTVAFTNRSYPINPGSPVTFPWLSSIAQNYQQYKIHGIIFEFRPLMTDFVTAGAPGVVVMATNYNADEPPYTTKQQMENSEFAVSVKPTCNLMHGVECAANQSVLSELYVRPAGLAAGLDLKFTDLGNFQFASQGNPVQLLGELWVSYTIEFFKPILPTDVGGNVQSQLVTRNTVVAASPLGITPSTSKGDLLSFVISATQVSWYMQPNNFYQVTIGWNGSITGVVTFPNFSFSNCTAVATFKDRTNNTIQGPGTGDNTTQMLITLVVQCTSPNPVFGFVTLSPTGVFPTGTTRCDLLITQVSGEIYDP